MLSGDFETWPAALDALTRRFGTTFLLTLGARGAVLIEPGAPALAVPALAVNTVDTTGAGDVFAGVFLAAWLNGRGKPQAARIACRAASLSTTAKGALGYLPDALTAIQE